MEPFIIDGDLADINQFPHSAYLSIRCNKKGIDGVYLCGASIVNQYLTLTAAHCTYKCTKNTFVTVYVGHNIWYHGASATAHSFIEHEHFDLTEVVHDICLVRLNSPLKFGPNVNRVALMKNPPYNEVASIAGWGQYDVSMF